MKRRLVGSTAFHWNIIPGILTRSWGSDFSVRVCFTSEGGKVQFIPKRPRSTATVSSIVCLFSWRTASLKKSHCNPLRLSLWIHVAQSVLASFQIHPNMKTY